MDKFSTLQEILFEELEGCKENMSSPVISLFQLVSYVHKLGEAIDMRNKGVSYISGTPQKFPVFPTIEDSGNWMPRE